MPDPDATFAAKYAALVQEEQQLMNALDAQRARWLSMKNVVGYGVGLPRRGAKYRHELAAVFVVERKQPASTLDPKHRIPRTLNVHGMTVPTDVEEAGTFGIQARLGDPTANQQRHRPAKMGTSVKICGPGADDNQFVGTLGARVTEASGATKYLLSAGHVFLMSGDDVVQPETGHNRRPIDANERDRVATVVKVSLPAQGVDAGIAEVGQSSAEILHIGVPSTPQRPVAGLFVQKSGRSTGLTTSVVVLSHFAGGGIFATMRGLFAVQNECQASPPLPNPPAPAHPVTPPAERDRFSLPGDSGSLIVAGHPDRPREFGVRIDELVTGSAEEDAKVRAMQRAALGLLVGSAEGQAPPPSTPGGHGPPSPPTTVRYTLGQRIEHALDAMKVTLDTS